MLTGKPKIGSAKGQMIQFTCRISKGQAYILERVAKEENLSMSEIIRHLITESLTSGYLSTKFNLEIVAGAGPREKKE
jgi:hypothetical protein